VSDYDVIVIGSCTNAYVEMRRFLTVPSDDARPARSAARHDPAVSDILGDLHGGASTRLEK
jgi:hypothetical protein